MSAAILEVHDHELRLARDGEVIARSPGCAIVDKQTVLLGSEARAQAYLQPRNFHNKFWYQLNQAALTRGSRAVRSHADLAYRHLAQLASQTSSLDSVVIAVPGGFSKQQLALLLGIGQASSVTPIALVDSALASAASCAAAGDYKHIDMQLHRTVITELSVTERVVRGRVQVIDNVGLDRLYNQLAAHVADQFISQSRFDPLHQASTEQLLHNELPGWITLLHDAAEIKVAIEFRQSRFEARLTRESIVAAADPLYREILSRIDVGSNCLIGERLAQLPGFSANLKSSFELSATSVFDGCAQLATGSSKPDAGLHLITELPACADPFVFPTNTVVATDLAAASPVATHIVSNGCAYALSAKPLHLNADGGVAGTASGASVAQITQRAATASLVPTNGAALKLNGRKFDGSEISPGDEITLESGAASFLAICLVAPHA